MVVALGSTLVALNEAGKLGAANWLLVGALLVVGAIGFTSWNVEKRVAHPLVSTTYMKQRRTWALLLTTTLTMTGVFAVMNGLIPNLAQDSTVGAGLSADTVSWVTLTPYAFAGLLMGPVAGKLAGRLGYNRVLQIGLIGTAIGLGITMLAANFPHQLLFLFIFIFVGITYAGMSNIMLNGLGIVLSPKDNPGYLPWDEPGRSTLVLASLRGAVRRINPVHRRGRCTRRLHGWHRNRRGHPRAGLPVLTSHPQARRARRQGGEPTMTRKIILDCDPGHDDAIAMILAVRQSRHRPVGNHHGGRQPDLEQGHPQHRQRGAGGPHERCARPRRVRPAPGP